MIKEIIDIQLFLFHLTFMFSKQCLKKKNIILIGLIYFIIKEF